MPQLVLRGLVGKDEDVGQLGLDLGSQHERQTGGGCFGEHQTNPQ